MVNITSIPVIFDKSHLVTIGERLYSTGLDLIRELVSNAYDADAAKVSIEILPDKITIDDNGSGMDEGLLRQYFTIGSQEKKLHSLSPVFHRKRVGEFGIGKFSALTIAERFIVETQQKKNQFRARLVFDSAEWRRDPENWQVPCEILPCDPTYSNGTRIILEKIKKPLETSQVVRQIRERFPLGDEDFRIFVNGTEVTATTTPGKRFPVNFSTPFGLVIGEIILANIPATQRNITDAGVTIRVKSISITKSLFGFDASHSIGISRLRGSVNADFLPITSSRDSIIQDSEEYKVFFNKMRENVREVIQYAKNFAFQRENTQASLVLRDALDKIGRAVKKNPDVFENNFSEPPLGIAASSNANFEEGYEISKAQIIDTDLNPAFSGIDMPDNGDVKQKPVKRRHLSLANRAVIRKMHFRNLGIICRMERFGFAYPPSFIEQGIIFINIDHPLYRKQIDNSPSLTMFIATLITKELAVQKYPHDTSLAFNLQTQLLTDAFKDVRKL